MENLLATTIHGKPTHFCELFRSAIKMIDGTGVAYSLIGTLALNMYVRPRFTDEIQILCSGTDSEQISSLLKSVSFNDDEGPVFVRVNDRGGPENLHALSNRNRLPLFGATAPFPSALSLLWIFLQGDEYQDMVDAGQLLRSGLVKTNEIQSLLEQNQSVLALKRLKVLCADIRNGRDTGSYSDSVKARLLRRQLRGTNHQSFSVNSVRAFIEAPRVAYPGPQLKELPNASEPLARDSDGDHENT